MMMLSEEEEEEGRIYYGGGGEILIDLVHEKTNYRDPRLGK